MPFTENFSDFLSESEFASAGTWSVGPTPISLIFDSGFQASEIGSIAGFEGASLTGLVATASVPTIAHGQTLVIGGTTYTVRGVQPDGTGMTTLILEAIDGPTEGTTVAIYWTQAEDFGADPDADGETNAAAIQQALDVGGYVTLMSPGIYEVSTDGVGSEILTIGNNTLFQLGLGVTLRAPAAPTVALPIIANSNWRSNSKSVSTMTSETSSAPYITTVTATTTDAHGYAAGDYVLVKGDTTGYYNGIWLVDSAPSSTTFTFTMFGVNPTPPDAAGTLIVYAANGRFSIHGGTFDSNSNITDGPMLGEVGRMGGIFNKCGDYEIRSAFVNAGKFGIYYCNSWRATFNLGSIKGPSDAFHGNGPLSQIQIGGTFTANGDDIVPLLTDNFGYTDYDLKDADGTKNSDGDISDVIIENVQITAGGSRTLMLGANDGWTISRVTMRNNQRASSLSGLYIYLETQATGTGNFEDILIDGVYGNYSGTSNPVVFAAAAGTQNITNLTIRNVGVHGGEVDGTPFAFAAQILGFGNGVANVYGLTLEGIDVDCDLTNSAAAGVRLLEFGAGSGLHTITNLKISNVSMRGTGTTRALAGVVIGSNGTWSSMLISDVILSGNLASFVYCTSTQSGTGSIQLSNCYADGNGNNGQTVINTTGGRSLDIFLDNVIHKTNPNHTLAVTGGSGKTFNCAFNNVRVENKLFDFTGATSHTINVRLSNVYSANFTPAGGNMIHAYGTTCTWNFYGNCLDIGVDLSSIARRSGTIIFNTNSALGTLAAAGPVVGQGTSSNSWRLMGDPTKQY